jgi:hypothetical protein
VKPDKTLVPFTSEVGDHIMTSKVQCVIYDLLYNPDQKVLFTGLLSLRIADFAYAIELDSERLLKIQIGAFSSFLRDFAINGAPFLHSAACVCDNPTLFRIVYIGSDISAADCLMWRRTAVFSALRNPNMYILQTLIDAKIDINIDQCDVKRCSPLIHCLQMVDFTRANSLLDSCALVHRTFSGKHTSVLKSILREAKPTISAFFFLAQATKSTFAARTASSLSSSAPSTISLPAFTSSISRPVHLIRILRRPSAPTRSSGY